MKVSSIVFPCAVFVDAKRGFDWCKACGFHNSLHGLNGDELLAGGHWDPRKFTTGMEDEPQRKAWIELQRELAAIKGAPSADEVLLAVNNAPHS